MPNPPLCTGYAQANGHVHSVYKLLLYNSLWYHAGYDALWVYDAQ